MKKNDLLRNDWKLSFWNFISWCFDFSWKNKNAFVVLLALLIIFWINVWVTLLFVSIQALWLLLFQGAWKIIWSFCFSLISPFVTFLLVSAFVVWLTSLLLSIVKWHSSKIWILFKSITWKNIWRILWWTLLIWLIFWIAIMFVFWLCALIFTISGSVWLVALISFVFCAAICFFAIKFKFFSYAVVDKSFETIQAFEYSWKITKWHFWEIVLLYLLFLLIIFVPYLILWLFVFLWNTKLLIVMPVLIILMVIFLIPMMLITFSKYYLIISEKFDALKKEWTKKV